MAQRILSVVMIIVVLGSLVRALPTQYRCETVEYCARNNQETGLVEIVKCSTLGITCCPAPGNKFNLVKLQQNQACCSGQGKIYTKSTEICVGGNVRDREEFEENCGEDKAFNVKNQVCCRSGDRQITRVYEKVEGGQCCNENYLKYPNRRCCGGVDYLKNESVCCENTDAFGETVYTVKHTDFLYGQCCYNTPYNPNSHKCGASGVIVPKETLTKCKKNLYYDPTDTGCCARSELYNLNTQICYEREIYSKNLLADDSVCLNRDRTSISYTTYKSGPEYACTPSGEVIRLKNNQMKCGGKIINTTTDLCCTGSVVHSNVNKGTKCCVSGTKIYNPKTQSCCMNEVSEDVAEINGSECCFKLPFNPETHTCSNATRKISVNQCALTEKKKTTIKKLLNSKGISVFIVKAVHGIIQSKSTRWELADVRQLKGKKSLKLAEAGEDKYVMEGKSSTCLDQVKEDEEYIIVTKSKFKSSRNREKRIKLDFKLSHIIALKNKETLGNFLVKYCRNRNFLGFF